MNLSRSFAEPLTGVYVPVEPTGFPHPERLLLNHSLAKDLSVNPEDLTAELLTGTGLPSSIEPVAMAYSGHQFGGFSPLLGDGRAMLLGELTHADGRVMDLQLKGSGRTPFSRGGDGRATLGPILREYIVGEAMHHLGIPTTRALAVATTGDQVWRQERLPGAVLARVASSHLRVGTFEFVAGRRDPELMARVVRYALTRHYPDALEHPHPARALLEEVARAQASLVAAWMHVGFVHGVMNTDNTTVSGETIDYGPCAFLDTYDPATVFSSIDRQGRYAFGRQAQMGLWNVTRFAESLLSVLGTDPDAAVEVATEALGVYPETYDRLFLDGMRSKLGLVDSAPGDLDLVTDLFGVMHGEAMDYTNTFRLLATALRAPAPSLLLPPALGPWVKRWTQRVDLQSPDRMDAVNPIYIPRNHLVEDALDAAVNGDLSVSTRLIDVLAQPFVDQDLPAFARGAPGDFGPYQTFCGT